MKKTYIIPQTSLTEIHLRPMMAGSGRHLMDPENDGYADPDGDVLSRRRGWSWDDYEDDEEE